MDTLPLVSVILSSFAVGFSLCHFIHTMADKSSSSHCCEYCEDCYCEEDDECEDEIEE